MRSILQLCLVITTLFATVSNQAFAIPKEVDFVPHMELGFGYGDWQGTADVSGAGWTQFSREYTLGGNLRLGGRWDWVYILGNFNYDYGSVNRAASSDSLGEKGTKTWTTVGFIFGFELEYLPLRWYLGIDTSNSQSVNLVYSDSGATKISGEQSLPSPTRLGLDYFLTEKVMLNLEYVTYGGDVVFNSVSNAGVVTKTSAAFSNRTYFIRLVFPFETKFPDTPWRERYRGKIKAEQQSSGEEPVSGEEISEEDASDVESEEATEEVEEEQPEEVEEEQLEEEQTESEEGEPDVDQDSEEAE